MTHDFSFDPQLALQLFPWPSQEYGPETHVWTESAQAALLGADPSVPVLPNAFLVPLVQRLDSIRRRLVTTTEKETVFIPQRTNTRWYATAICACFEYSVLQSTDAKAQNPTF